MDVNLETFSSDQIQLDVSWKHFLEPEFRKSYMISLKNFLQKEIKQGKTIYPQGRHVFSAMNSTPFEQIKIVIIGQDPYHGPNQAHGLCFSVQPGMKKPPSLINIFKELKEDLNIPYPSHGYLKHWTDQGVFLLNNVLTVEKNRAASHVGKGWEMFTDRIIEIINQQKKGVIFLLWGKFAQNKGHSIDQQKHLVLTSSHPSPFSAHRGFFGCQHFSKANQYLKEHNKEPIGWALPDISHPIGQKQNDAQSEQIS